MGCDIHSMIEVRDRNHYNPDDPSVYSDTWYNAGDGTWGMRSYAIFAVLAGVRNMDNIRPISGPRGIPGGASEAMQSWYESWAGDAHSASWVSLAELKAYDKDYAHADRLGERGFFSDRYGAALDRIISDMEKAKRFGADDDGVRLVFFFDN